MKTIIFCADGTWNGPGEDKDGDGVPETTNVWKLFQRLDGRDVAGTALLAKEQERSLYDEGGGLLQIAKYIHGVGDSDNKLVQLLGGAFGAGVIARVVRGYTFISRNYQPGDRIILVGFSRGAYTARALGDFIITKGLLDSADLDKEYAYRLGAAAWYEYRRGRVGAGLLGHLTDIVDNLPGFLAKPVPAAAWVTGVKVTAIAVWDTVGALGIPEYRDDVREDVFAFTGTTLDTKVEYGFHAVSLDDQRKDFAPTLWQPRTDGSLVQMLFAGAHADVGGGYPTAGNESGLSDIALEWMIERLSALPTPVSQSVVNFTATVGSKSDPFGVAHQPWLSWPFSGRPTGPRSFCGQFPGKRIDLHDSVFARLGQSVKSDPTLVGDKYLPTPCRTCDKRPPAKGPCCA